MIAIHAIQTSVLYGFPGSFLRAMDDERVVLRSADFSEKGVIHYVGDGVSLVRSDVELVGFGLESVTLFLVLGNELLDDLYVHVSEPGVRQQFPEPHKPGWIHIQSQLMYSVSQRPGQSLRKRHHRTVSPSTPLPSHLSKQTLSDRRVQKSLQTDQGDVIRLTDGE